MFNNPNAELSGNDFRIFTEKNFVIELTASNSQKEQLNFLFNIDLILLSILVPLLADKIKNLNPGRSVSLNGFLNWR
jgi:hypothetical protein